MIVATAVLTVVVLLAIRRAVVAWSHHRRKAPRTTFRCKMRPVDGSRWPVNRCRGVWVHDVLVIERGLLFPHTLAFPVRLPEDAVRQTTPDEVAGLGRRPVVITLRLDDGTMIDLAAAARHRTSLVGPFLAAAIPGLGRGRRETPGGWSSGR